MPEKKGPLYTMEIKEIQLPAGTGTLTDLIRDQIVDEKFMNEIRVGLAGLGNFDLSAFHIALHNNSQNPRQDCESKPWFKKVELLFTENDGQNVSSKTRNAIKKLIEEKLLQNF